MGGVVEVYGSWGRGSGVGVVMEVGGIRIRRDVILLMVDF